MARELSPYHIRVNVLQPGHIASATEVEGGHTPGSDARKAMGARIPVIINPCVFAWPDSSDHCSALD